MSDAVLSNVVSLRSGHESCVIWATRSLPAKTMEQSDQAVGIVDTSLDNGSVFRVIAYAPGVAARWHQTITVDYAVVLSGEIDLELDTETVHLRQGDVLVQQATRHNWANNSSAPCLLGVVLIAAERSAESSARASLDAAAGA